MPKDAKKKDAKKAARKPPAAKKKAAPRKPMVSRSRASTAKPARKPTGRGSSAATDTVVVVSVTAEDIALKAYYLAERRRSLGLPGDPESDWLEAERLLRR